jgi:hypothetical protein
MLTTTAGRLAALTAAILALAACGTTASPAQTVAPSSGGGPASAAAATSAGPTNSQSPGPSAAVAAPCDKAPKRFDPKQIDLTGAWSGDDDGIYYLRQVGSVVWWNGMSGRADNPSNLGRDWNNVGRGEIKELNIEVEWADVPRGEILGNGTLSLKIADDGTGNVTIVKVSETGTGFGNNVWTPCTPG